MVVDNNIQNNAKLIGNIQENRVGIDTANVDFITNILTSSLYSNPLQSFLRETISNAYDSQVEAGNEEHPIILYIEQLSNAGYYSQLNTYFNISIRDYGTGLSPERFDQIYKFIGSSTKRESNDYIGKWGLGRLSCLSVADKATVTSYYNGTKYSYMMYKNDGGINIDRINTSETDSPNGLEVNVKVTTNLKNLRTALESLVLFENLIIKYTSTGSVDSCYEIRQFVENFNNRKIIKYKSYVVIPEWCESITSSRTIAHGKVLYPCNVSYGIFKNYSYAFNNVIPTLEIGTVSITPSRESLLYDAKTDKALKEAWEKADEELESILKSYMQTDYKDLFSFYTTAIYGGAITVIDIKNQNCKYEVPARIKDKLIDIYTLNGKLLSNVEIQFIISFFDMPFKLNTREKPHYKYTYRSSEYSFKETSFRQLALNNFTIIYKKCNRYKTVTKAYLKQKYDKSVILTKEDVRNIIKKCESYNLSNTKLRMVLSCIPYIIFRNEEVSVDFIKEYKDENTSKKEIKDKSEVGIRLYVGGGYSKYTLNLALKAYSHSTFVYTHNGDKEGTLILKDLSNALNPNDSHLKFCSVTKESLPLFENLHNFQKLEEFLNTKHKYIAKVATAKYLKSFPIAKIVGIDCYYKNDLIRDFRYYENAYSWYSNYNGSGVTYIHTLLDKYIENKWLHWAAIAKFGITEEQVAKILKYHRILDNANKIAINYAIKELGCDSALNLKIKNYTNIKNFLNDEHF